MAGYPLLHPGASRAANIDRLKEQNVTFLGNTPTPLTTDSHFVLDQDPDGTFVELIGPL